MFRRGLSFVVLLAVPLVASAQGGTERYLPSGSQIVLQVDNVQRTQAAYNKTVQGQLWSGETGKFARNYYKWIKETAETAATEFQQPAKEDVVLIKDLITVFEKIADEGVAMGIEVKQAWPPQARIVVALPRVGTGDSNMVKLIKDIRAKAQELAGQKVEIQEEMIGGRTIYTVDAKIVQVGWFAQGDDFLMTIGTGKASDYVTALDSGKTGVANNAVYKQLFAVGDFPVRTRAYVDVPSLVKLSDQFGPDIVKTVDELGLKSFGPVLTVSGFDGPSVRTITEIEVIGKPKGFAAAIVGNKPVSLTNLPPMPSDLTTFTAVSSNFGKYYTTFMDVGEKVGKIYFPDQVDNFKQTIRGFEDVLNVNLKDDLFDSLDDFSITYYAPSEGVFKGGTTLFRVKDEAKLKKAIANLVGGIPNIPGADAAIKKRKFRNVEIYEMQSSLPGNFTVTSFCVYKGYLCYANFPQQVRGYILRQDGVLPAWKMDERLSKALAAFPKEFTSVTFDDPQNSIQGLLAEAPAFVTFLNGFTRFIPGVTPFDISQIPHAQEATRNVFPNITITTDDGKKLRIDQRVSVGG